jgi:5-methylcytosine-specific restriction endonuclease McrA
MRQRVFRRDKGICALCGIDTTVLGKVLAAEWQRVKMASTARERRERAEFRKRYRWFFRRRSYWDADHIVPVVEGGGECTMANIRTLCVPCHQRVTKDLARRQASQRRQRTVGYEGLVALKIVEAE